MTMCEYCEKGKPFPNDYTVSAVRIMDGNILDTDVESFEIKFCPWCGERLRNKNEQMETIQPKSPRSACR